MPVAQVFPVESDQVEWRWMQSSSRWITWWQAFYPPGSKCYAHCKRFVIACMTYASPMLLWLSYWFNLTTALWFQAPSAILQGTDPVSQKSNEAPLRKNRECPFLSNWENRETKFEDSLLFTRVWFFKCWLLETLHVFPLYVLFILNFIIFPRGLFV